MNWSVFPNGTSFLVWRERNCERCKKDYSNRNAAKDGTNPLCLIETEMSLASVRDGRIRPEMREEIRKRLNWDGKTYLETDCPEREPK